MTKKERKIVLPGGKCNFCGNRYSVQGMSAHLKKCVEKDKQDQALLQNKIIKLSSIFHIVVRGECFYWLQIEADGKTTLYELDSFLRDIWVECCMHLSMFRINDINYSYSPMKEYDERSMNVALHKALKPGTRFDYEYDFGSTTHLILKVLGVRTGKIDKKGIRLLARNDAPEILCSYCDNLATDICAECSEWTCKNCRKKHECDEEMLLPVVNSPRAGVCGYCG
ncbi:MAG: hypothetical protein A2Y62_19605 [Candidatus Fischerbacteria bacterium RBG_13_37_8]|uniref:Uncharacterized protein n=1 Tax=Candidatus Fischerbacteria bacterium RBG_13_37_8 TaxID=1817863 RepID=A0A1F5VXI2_9BACT|nr:MAG: hypothetical protein A2Y62_19605 [Candidatus Fischerbacteria bacterium RBG_13_37_8]